ncbi:MAG: LuxR C-terminal-related transcriptional regulator [Acidimicrobiia bacterium]
MDLPLLGRDRELVAFENMIRRDTTRSIVLYGQAGVGKSRLASAFLDVGKRLGFPVRRVAATRAGCGIPFGAVSHLLPATGPEASQTDLMLTGFRAITDLAVDGKLMIGVDDAHVLDPGSATLIHQVAVAGSASLVVSVRAGEAMPDPIFKLWKDGHAERLTIEPLARETIFALANRVLGERVEQRLLFALWRLSEGNPLLFHELITGGIESGALRMSGGVWSLSGDLAGAARVTEVVATRIEGLTPELRECLELVAEGDPIPIELLEAAVGLNVIEALERSGLVGLDETGVVRMAHPLYGEVLDSLLAVSRKRAIQERLAEMFESLGVLERENLIRVAKWRVESGTPTEPSLLVEAARHAHAAFDNPLAERLGKAALEQGGGFEAELVVAEAISGQGAGARAESLLAALAATSRSAEHRAQVGLARAANQLFLLRSPGAIDLLIELADAINDSLWRTELESMIVFATSYVGRVDESISTAERLLARSDISKEAWLRTMVLYSYARLLRGRFAELEDDFQKVVELAADLKDVFPLLEDISTVNHLGIHRFSGEFIRGVPAVQAKLEEAIARGAPEPIGLWSFQLGVTLSMAGDLDGAVAAHEEALACLRDHDSVGLTPLPLLDLTYVHAASSKADAAHARFQQYLEIIRGGSIYPFGETGFRRAEAWLKYLNGDMDDAVETSRLAGEVSVDNGELVLGMLALHDSVRWGCPNPVVEGLDHIAGEVEGRLAGAFADHARSLSENDAEALERVSMAFEAMGAWLYAAESGMQAASIYGTENHTRQLRRARARASLLAARCPGARTPALREQTMSMLTARESEVADLAVRGLTSAEIADRLVVSIRTVDNHLGSVYRKLGVQGRSELPGLVSGPDRGS